ncbi:hypothetical protein D3C86_610590 [compost metagenome]
MSTEAARRILLTGGRAPVTLELARLFHAAGHEVHVAESLPEQLCRASKAVRRNHRVPSPRFDREGFLGALERIIREERIDLLIPTCEEVFHVAAGHGRLPCEVLAPPREQLRRLHSKWEFIKEVAAQVPGDGVRVPETRLVEGQESLEAAIAAFPAGSSIVFKPVFSRFGTHVRIHRPVAPLPDLGATPAQPWVAQEFVPGPMVCTYAVARQGRLLAYSAYRGDYTAGPGASIYFAPLERPGLEAWVRDLVAREGLTGQISFDFIDADGTLYPLECNPRATSGVHLFGPGDGLVEALLGTRDDTARPRPETRSMLVLAMGVYALPKVRSWQGLTRWVKDVRVAKDALFRREDPAPLWQQAVLLASLGRIAQREGVSLIEASTWDIEWNGDA